MMRHEVFKRGAVGRLTVRINHSDSCKALRRAEDESCGSQIADTECEQ